MMFPTRSIVRIGIQTFMYEKQRLSFNLIAFCARLLLLRIMEMEFKQDRAEPMGLQ